MYEWDEQNLSHIAKHGVSAEEAEEVIENNPLDLELQFINGEERVPSLGETKAGRILLVVSRWIEEKQSIRVVTAFDPKPFWREKYLVWKGKQYGERVENPGIP